MASEPAGNFMSQNVDISVREADLGGGFHASLDVSVINWSQRPTNSPLLPQNNAFQLYVRQLELSFRRNDMPVAFLAGRIWPWHTPGLGVLDGVQAGWHDSTQTLEIGAVAGAQPNAVSTAPTFQQPLAGVYLTTSGANPNGVFDWLQGSAVVSGFQVTGQGWHYALDAVGLATKGRTFDGSAELRVGGGVLSSPGNIEAARLDLNLRPSDRLQLGLSARYLYENVGEVIDPGQTTSQDASIHALASAAYEFQSFTVGLAGGFAEDLLTHLGRGWVGPDVAWPRLFGSVGGLTVGYEEDIGWLRGRDAYVQATLHPGTSFRFSGRLFYFYTDGGAVNTAGGLNSAGASLQADYIVARWLKLRAAAMAQTDVRPSTTDLPQPLGLTLTGGATGYF
jgi:hypothetical protein